MQNFQLSLFYDLQAMILASDFLRKYHLLFQALDLSPMNVPFVTLVIEAEFSPFGRRPETSPPPKLLKGRLG